MCCTSLTTQRGPPCSIPAGKQRDLVTRFHSGHRAPLRDLHPSRAAKRLLQKNHHPSAPASDPPRKSVLHNYLFTSDVCLGSPNQRGVSNGHIAESQLKIYGSFDFKAEKGPLLPHPPCIGSAFTAASVPLSRREEHLPFVTASCVGTRPRSPVHGPGWVQGHRGPIARKTPRRDKPHLSLR